MSHFLNKLKNVSYQPADRKRIDFSDPDMVSKINSTLLQRHFNLNVNLPTNHLIPCVPSKLDYILYLEDFLISFGIDYKQPLRGLDIGCGASCIHGLLATRLHPQWTIVATEINQSCYLEALENIKQNNSNVRLVKINSNDESIVPAADSFDFCICNPPFYTNINKAQGLDKKCSIKRNSLNTGSLSEIVYEDKGEIGFVERIFNCSRRIRLCVIMLGHKSSLVYFVRKFGDINSIGFRFDHVRMCQGKTARWLLAWSWQCSIDRFIICSCKERNLSLPSQTKSWIKLNNFTTIVNNWLAKYKANAISTTGNSISVESDQLGRFEIKQLNGDIRWIGVLNNEALNDLTRTFIRQSNPISAIQLNCK